MPSKKRVHLQQSAIISLAKSKSNLHQESWEKQVDFPNCWDNHKLCKWVGKSYKKLYCTEIITKACLLRCKITHTHIDYSHHWYIRTRLQCGDIFMMRYAKSHTHTQITVIIDTSEQGYNAAISSWRDMQNHTHTHRSCCTWLLNKLHFCWWLRELIPGMTKESFCLAMRPQSILNLHFWFARAFCKWRENAWW
jgi:hypothetical protein